MRQLDGGRPGRAPGDGARARQRDGGGAGRGVTAGVPGSLHRHATDGEGEWWVGFDDGAVAGRHEHAKGDVAVRGPASDLLLFIWNRRSRAGLEIIGDESMLDVWADKI